MSLEELGGLSLQDDESEQTEEDEDDDQDQPVPPNLVFVRFDAVQDSRTVVLSFSSADAVVALKFGNEGDADSVRETAKVASPAQPDWDQVGTHEESGEQHLRDEQQRKHLLAELGIFHGASQHDGHRGGCHCKSVHGDEKEPEAGLESDHEKGDQQLHQDLQRGDEGFHREARHEVRDHGVMVRRVFALLWSLVVVM